MESYPFSRSPQNQQALVAYLQQLDQWISQHEMGISNWDPMANGGSPMGAYQNGLIPQNGPTPSYQDTNKKVYDDNVGSINVPPSAANKADGREEHYYAPPYDVTIPGSATATISAEPDPNNPSKQRVVMTVRYSDGTEKKLYFYHVDWKNGDLAIHAVSPDDQITIDASLGELASKVKLKELGEESQTEALGNPPTNGSDEWDGDSFEIHSTSGEAENLIMARNEVNFVADSNKEYWTVEWDSAKNQYVIKIYDDSSCTEDRLQKTFRVDKMTNTSITFNIDPAYIQFLDDLGDPSDPDHHTVNSSDPNGEILSFAGDDASSEYPEDSVPSKKEGSASELQKAVANKIFPPQPKPNQALIELLADVDPELQNLLDALKHTNGQVAQGNAMKQVSERIIVLLKALYPGVDIQMQYDPFVAAAADNNGDDIPDNQQGTPTLWYANNIVFGGQVMEAVSEGNKGELGTLISEWY